jgi:hypothetical protein
MKLEQLLELDAGSNAIMTLMRTVPHMAAAGIDTSVDNITRYTNVDQAEVRRQMPKVLKKLGGNLTNSAGDVPPEVHAVIAAVRYIQANKIPALERTPEFFEELTDIPYQDLYNAAAQYTDAIQQQVANFRLNWIGTIQQRKFGSFTPEEQKAMIRKEMLAQSQGHQGKVAAIDIAKALVINHHLTDSPDNLRRTIDGLLSSDDPEMNQLDKHRVIGRSYRGPQDNPGGIKTW